MRRSADGLASPHHRTQLTVKLQAHDYQWWHFFILLAGPPTLQLTSLLVPYLSTHFVASWDRWTKAPGPLLSAGLGVLCFLFINVDFVSGNAPLRRYLDDKRLVPFTLIPTTTRNTFMDEKKIKKKGVF